MADMVIVPSGCKKSPKPHPPHYWVEGWIWPKTIDCPGIPEKKSEPVQHRHFYKLTRIYKYPYSFGFSSHGISKTLIAWQCECGSFRRRDRVDFLESMLANRWKGVDQTWPS